MIRAFLFSTAVDKTLTGASNLVPGAYLITDTCHTHPVQNSRQAVI
ncbi:MAG: hypothetical protein OXC53_06410 [Rhodobacteraceae bacterium]|nr:hypothetical protein [Paracoccaceae bacterium]